jgi:hypothetical protein
LFDQIPGAHIAVEAVDSFPADAGAARNPDRGVIMVNVNKCVLNYETSVIEYVPNSLTHYQAIILTSSIRNIPNGATSANYSFPMGSLNGQYAGFFLFDTNFRNIGSTFYTALRTAIHATGLAATIPLAENGGSTLLRSFVIYANNHRFPQKDYVLNYSNTNAEMVNTNTTNLQNTNVRAFSDFINTRKMLSATNSIIEKKTHKSLFLCKLSEYENDINNEIRLELNFGTGTNPNGGGAGVVTPVQLTNTSVFLFVLSLRDYQYQDDGMSSMVTFREVV